MDAARIAVVTGAGSGLGRATAYRLAEDGFHVACLDLIADTAAATAEQIEAAGRRAIAMQCDVSDEKSVGAAFEDVRSAFDRVDSVINVAGIAMSGHFVETTVDQWQRILDVNLTGTFLVAKAAMPDLLSSRGCMVNVASVAALRGWRYMAAYSASKGGIVALTRTLAVEFGRKGVRVNCVCPGSIATPLKDALRPVQDADPELLNRGGALVDPPVADTAEIAGAIGYLVSPQARFITGTVLTIDGGTMA